MSTEDQGKAAEAVNRLRRTVLWIFLGIPGIILLLWLLFAVLASLAEGPSPILFG